MTEAAAQIETPAPPATPAEAATRLDQLKTDPAWMKAFLAGAGETVKQFQDLHQMIAKGDEVDAAMAGVLPELRTSQFMEMIGTASMLRETGIRDEIIKDVLAGTHQVTKAEYDATVRWKADHLSNAEWGKRLTSGDNEARRELALANIIITGGIKEESAA